METDDNNSAIHDVFPFGPLNGHMLIVCNNAICNSLTIRFWPNPISSAVSVREQN